MLEEGRVGEIFLALPQLNKHLQNTKINIKENLTRLSPSDNEAKARKQVRMQKRIYTIRDSKAEIFNQPFYYNTHGEAERAFKQLVMDEKSSISKFPEDYDLYYLGLYDDNSGKIESLDTPQHVIKAVNLRS